MAKYQLTVQVNRASGHQTWEVEADSREDAIKVFDRGEGEIVDEELEVESLARPHLPDVRPA